MSAVFSLRAPAVVEAVVGHLVREHAGQLVVGLDLLEEAAGDPDEAAGDGDGVRQRVIEDLDVVLQIGAVARGGEPANDLLNARDLVGPVHGACLAIVLLGDLAALLSLVLERPLPAALRHSLAHDVRVAVVLRSVIGAHGRRGGARDEAEKKQQDAGCALQHVRASLPHAVPHAVIVGSCLRDGQPAR